jgi:hypothetical protein
MTADRRVLPAPDNLLLAFFCQDRRKNVMLHVENVGEVVGNEEN